MKLRIWSLFLVSGVLFSTLPIAAQAKETILVTTFEPFEGRSVNNSDVFAQAAAQLLANSADSGIDVKICRLPVDFQKAAPAAQACYESMNPKPTTVISLGEKSSCGFLLETQAFNGDLIPPSSKVTPIAKGKPMWQPSNFPAEEIYCSYPPALRKHIVVSGNADDDQCNDLLYKMTNYFKGTGVRYGLIHVPDYLFAPVSGLNCPNHPSVAEDAKTLASLLESAASFGREPNQALQQSGIVPCPFKEMELPIDAGNLQDLLKKIKGDDDLADCKRQIMENLDPMLKLGLPKTSQ